RSVTYDNPMGNQGVDIETANVVASDGTTVSNTAVATIDMPPIVQLSATPNYSTNWYNSGAIPTQNMVQSSVTDRAGVATLSSMTVTLVSPHAGDVLAMPILPGITALTTSFSGGVLTISGTDTVAHYQQELRFINYNNTSGGPGVGSVQATVVASDG